MSGEAESLVRRILVLDPARRYTLAQVQILKNPLDLIITET